MKMAGRVAGEVAFITGGLLIK